MTYKMTDQERQLYELVHCAGVCRFGSVCKHIKVKNGYCVNCLRKVVVA